MTQKDTDLTENPRHPHADHGVSIFDINDPRAVVNLVPPVVRAAIESAYKKSPEYFQMDERQLRKALGHAKNSPTISDNRLRLNFWNEYDKTQATGSGQMNMATITWGICSKQFLYDFYIKDPGHVAWLLCMPTAYNVVLEEGLQYGLEQMREILMMDTQIYKRNRKGGVLKDENGHPVVIGVNTKLLEIKGKITEMLHVRIKGGIVQKQLNINATPAQITKMSEANTMEELQAKLLELDKREKAALNGPVNQGEPKFVKAEVVDGDGS